MALQPVSERPMTDKPPAKPAVIVIARPPRKRSKAVLAAVPTPTRIVYSPSRKQRDAWARYLAFTGRDE
jgi:hypothetical protein